MTIKFKLSTKLWGLTGLLLLAVLGVAVNSIWSISGILHDNHKYAEVADYSVFLVHKEVDHLKWVNRVQDLFVHKLDRTDVQLDYTKCGLGKFIYGEKAKEMASIDPEFAGLLEDLKKSHIDLHQSAGLINKTVQDAGHEKALEVFQANTLSALKQTQSKMKVLSDKLKEKETATEARMISTGAKSRWSAILVTAIAFILAGFLSFFVIRSITRPIKRIIEGLNEGSEQVASAAGQVSSASQSLAEGSSEQAASIEETSSSLEEMSSMTRQNANNACQADGLMQETNQVVAQANETMDNLTGSMQEISQASEETSKIIKTIDEIAFQTNLLALNAAVEAARAGEAGAGFAVVADEVRNLAMRAADAAKNTADLIEGTVKKVSDGSELVTRTNESFDQVTESSSKVGDLVAEIAAASNKQAQGIEQVNTAVSEMDKLTQSNAANAEESASASEELSAQAEQMKSMVGDLVTLVGGSGNSAARSIRKSRETRSTARMKAPVAAAPVGTSKSYPIKNLQIKSSRPEQLTPMDNDDFKEF